MKKTYQTPDFIRQKALGDITAIYQSPASGMTLTWVRPVEEAGD